MIIYFKDENTQWKKEYETLSINLKPIDTVVIIATVSTYVTLSVTGFGLLIIPISTGIEYLKPSGESFYSKGFWVNKKLKKIFWRLNKIFNLYMNFTENVYYIV